MEVSLKDKVINSANSQKYKMLLQSKLDAFCVLEILKPSGCPLHKPVALGFAIF
jgi:hypothetical protein